MRHTQLATLITLSALILLSLNTVSAEIIPNLTPDSISIDLVPSWVSVPYETSTISVHVCNLTNFDNGSYYNTSLKGVKVNFSVGDTSVGSVSPVEALTDINGNATTKFTSIKTSGNTSISSFIVDTNHSATTLQNIDHGRPYRISKIKASSIAYTGTMTNVSVAFSDRYGNPIDNRYLVENVTFEVATSPKGNTTLGTGKVKKLDVPVGSIEDDGSAYATVAVNMDDYPGMSAILAYIPGVDDTTIWIEGYGSIAPFEILIDPPADEPLVIPADGVSLATITFRVYDRDNEPVHNAYLTIATDGAGDPDPAVYKTDYWGVLRINYGPKITKGTINVNATALYPYAPGTYAFAERNITFVSTEPTTIVMIASPVDLPSWDLPGNETSVVSGRVIDQLGNGVSNQTITYSINPGIYPSSQVFAPCWDANGLSTISAVTDDEGYANVYFRPGYFKGEGYPQATGSCTVNAVWNGTNPPSPITLSWTNSPFLSVSVDVQPRQAKWNDTITVNITLIGNGYRLKANPIDAILCTDRSGSMLQDDPDRMVTTKAATKVFNGQLNSTDRVGLVTFGTSGTARIVPQYKQSTSRPYNWYWSWSGIYGSHYADHFWDPGWWWTKSDSSYECDPDSYSTSSMHHQYVLSNYGTGVKSYSGYATQDISLSFDKASVNSTIDLTVPSSGTPMRHALKTSIDAIKASPRSGATRAIVLMSDGDYNYYGDPLARGTGYTYYDPTDYGTDYGNLTRNYYKYTSGVSSQNMSRYAVDNQIKIFSIAFGDDLSADGKDTLSKLATTSGGQYFLASSDNLEEVYIRIAGILQENAGVNVTSDMDFGSISVSNLTDVWSITGDVGFIYIPNTRIDKWWWINGTMIDPYPIERDDTANWSANDLFFDVGTIKINQAWQVQYKLQLKPESVNIGQIELFGNDSRVSYVGGSVPIPIVYVSGVGNQTSTTSEDITNSTFTYSNVLFQDSGNCIYRWTFTRNMIWNGTANTTWGIPWKEEYWAGIANGILPMTKMGEQVFNLPSEAPDFTSGSYQHDFKSLLFNVNTTADLTFLVVGTDVPYNGTILATGQNVTLNYPQVGPTPTPPPTTQAPEVYRPGKIELG